MQKLPRGNASKKPVQFRARQGKSQKTLYSERVKIGGVANDGMADLFQMHTNLVSAPGMDFYGQKRKTAPRVCV